MTKLSISIYVSIHPSIHQSIHWKTKLKTNKKMVFDRIRDLVGVAQTTEGLTR